VPAFDLLSVSFVMFGWAKGLRVLRLWFGKAGSLRRLKQAMLASAALVILLGGAPSVSAETLAEAIASAYSSNPTLNAERARQRGTDEQVPQALSGWRPTITAEGSVSRLWSDPDAAPRTSTTPADATIVLSQPVFRGFKTINGTRSAEANVEAGRQSLLAVEQDIIFQVIQSYMNVIRDRKIVTLRQKNLAVLNQQLKAANDRFAVGEITKTDVAQSTARVAEAQAGVASANANLAISAANYEKIVGNKPGKLVFPKPARLPKNLPEAQSLAQEINPNILSAAFVAEASDYDVEVRFGDLLPELSLRATARLVEDDLDRKRGSSEDARVEGVLTIPLYEAGRVYSSVRQAKHVASQRKLGVIQSARAVREAVSNAWNNLISARQTIAAARSQVSASELALEGVRQEYLVGSRTTLDVLDAESELVAARITLVQAERDQIVASYQILGSIGHLTARDLKLAVDYYDAEANYLDVRGKWFGTGANVVE
jgi:outer membrane protein